MPASVSESEALAREAVGLRAAGLREEALAALQKALASAPEIPWAHAVLGEVLRELGGRRRGYAEVQKAIKLDPECAFAGKFLAAGRESAWAYGCRGGGLRAKGDLDGAAKDLEKAVALDAGCGWAWGWLGEIRMREGKLPEALAALNRAVGLFAEWPEAFFWRGEVKRALGRNEDALRDLDHAIALGYRQYDAYLSRAYARQALGDDEGYSDEMAAAVRSAPEIFRKQAKELDDKAAASWILSVLAGVKKSDALLAKASKELEARRFAKAAAILNDLLKADRRNAKAQLLLSEAWEGLGDGEAAIKAADQAVRVDPSAQTYARRAALSQENGYMESALRDVSVSLGLGQNGELFQWRARTFLGMRHYDLALQDLSTALTLEPDNAALYDLRAHCNLLLGRLGAAQDDVERALKIVPKQVNLHLRLGQLLALRKKFDEAHASVKKIVKDAPAWAHFIEGYVFCLEKRYDKAAVEFEKARAGAKDADAQLKREAGFYGTVAKAFSGTDKGDADMAKAKKNAKDKGKVYLCGLGVYPPQTATVEVLRGISECDVIFNNLPGLGMSEFLGLFCGNRRPVAFRYEQDAKLCADLVLSEVKPGRTVGFVTFGHPLLFGPLSHEIIQRCAKEGIPCKAFGAVSSMDAVLAASGQVLGYSYGGFQLFETTGNHILKEIGEANPNLPVIVYFAEGMGEQGMKQLVDTLGKVFPAGHDCLLYGPKHELWETQQERITLKDLAGISHHKLAQGILFVPPKTAK
jgi:tetratricopeptide (TPR) repeat protein